ncbi:hypothetical protein BV210_12435 [Halorientalis sp. IM1011]|uniref:hypothetical protein n=1 Tax=Halorientalis sp. IM1011 TaxID=1932360 RepID=UPI00097CC6F3|nr:hypothetical protein [Halorientalis sp. IM1011]AQL43447.1 hypothetical protein BV210_12435 [Halorientalis sp. IM1011]
MRRRALLAAVGTSCVAVGGCLGDGSDTDGKPDPTGTVDPRGDIPLVIHNQRDATSTVTVTVTAKSTTVFEKTAELDVGESTTLDPGLDETGEGYELIAETDGGRRDTLPFTVDDFALRNRLKLLVWILEDRVDTGIQE